MWDNYFLVFQPGLELLEVVVQPEYRANEQEGLPYIEQQTICHILYREHLVSYHDDTSHDEDNGHPILYFLRGVHSYNIRLAAPPPTSAVIM